MANKGALSSSMPKGNELRDSLHRNSASFYALKTASIFMRKANVKSAPTTYAIWAARLRALPLRCENTYIKVSVDCNHTDAYLFDGHSPTWRRLLILI